MAIVSSRDQRISQLQTKWDEIFAAHAKEKDGTETEIQLAQECVLSRYGGCVYNYLLGATQDHAIADELAQEFAFRFVRGDFVNAHPSKGRFRDYLKAALSNLVNEYFRQRPRVKPDSLHDSAVVAMPFENLENEFNQTWREEVIRSTWKALKEFDARKRNHYYTVLKLRAESPHNSSVQLATTLSQQLDQELTPDWVRQKLHRARQKFAEFLLAEVRKTIDDEDRLEEELADLKLLKYL